MTPEREIETMIEIPAAYVADDNCFVLFNTKKTDRILGNIGVVVQGESLEEAKKEFMISLKCHIHYLEQRSQQLDLWKPFQKGNWGHIGGTWFTVFGINVYFRYGNNMKYGWYVPFTKLNISIHNYWRREKKLNSDKNDETSVATEAK